MSPAHPTATASAALEAFETALRGTLIHQGDDGYDDARTIYNAMIDRRPRMIAYCSDVADVMAAIRFGRAEGLPVAIRGGGHNGPGLSLVDDGLVIDLSQMNGVRVNPEARTVAVEAGCTQGDVDHATHPFGLAIVAGIVSTTGVAGLTLGGGHGYLTRKHGLVIDNLLEVDVVLADGRFVTASADQHADLFWAVRGGGGNFGVVTRFLFRSHPVGQVYGGPIFWKLEDAPQVMAAYRDWLPDAPEEMGAFLGLKTVPPAPPFPEAIHRERICALIAGYPGEAEAAEAVLKPLRERVPPPIMDGMTTMPYPALQSLFDPLIPPGLQWYWKGDYVDELSDEAIAVHLEHAARAPSDLSLMHLYPIDGAVHRVGETETAWSARNARWSMVIAGIDPEPGKAEALRRWATAYWEAVHPFNRSGAYINFMMEEGTERIRATYGVNYDRLRRIKARYDPENFFRVNQNIPPA
ncbi:MAG: FAD-binding oxidoreductase [Puniceicoccaceae bacterium]|nr:MAG: FAD-binding oxidoreductase [Puniceicoccaceae bacterium]